MPSTSAMKRIFGTELAFALSTVIIIIVTHAIAYLTHEFAHTLKAWALGDMANPLALDYGSPTPANIVLLSDVSDNVQYDPILRAGHGISAAVIALAGLCIGNAALYVCLAVGRRNLRTDSVLISSLTFWLMLMCAGNIWSYVPIRAITTHADIAIAAAGLHVGVLPLFPILLLPSLVLVGHFFARTCPALIPVIAGGNPVRVGFIVATATAWFFLLFGGIGLSGSYGNVSQAFSIVSAVILMPLAALWLCDRCSLPVALK